MKDAILRLTDFSSYFPKKIISNKDIVEEMGSALNPLIIDRAVGSKNRRVATHGEMSSDMLSVVGLDLLRKSGLKQSNIGRLICSADPMDQAAPDTSVIAQNKIGLKCAAHGVSMSCVGWICGISNAIGVLNSTEISNIMVLASSTVGSKFFFENPMHRSIFGDGSGGVIISSDSDQGAEILGIDICTFGQFHSDIYGPLSWSDVPAVIPDKFKKTFYMNIDNRVYFDALDKYVKPFYFDLLKRSSICVDDISRFIVHQASMPIFEHTLKSFGIPSSKTANYYKDYGNTISAELPSVAHLELECGNIKQGDIVMFLTYGAGFTGGAMIVKF
ncbi:MAG: 3-oxoacyl-[acyl-carrier-protein] synthase-3 [Candidatus Omnitrophota bacterium]|jgi:3-oxoacyl-[acyl-carrier-protein] synthase-3